jgi:hypothetical protein
MKCGRGHQHDTVAEVRECYGYAAETVAEGQRNGTRPSKASGYRTNKFAGDCYRCRVRVAPGQGYIFRSPGVGSQRLGQGEWLVSHLDGQCVTPEEAADLDAIRTMQPRYAAEQAQRGKGNFKLIPQGYYATKSRTGTNDIDFWFVRVPDTGKWQGFRFVRRYLGGQGPIQIRTAEQMAALHAILEDGVEAAGMLFAQELGKCRKCGRDLTDETSRELGIGPVCRG